MPKRANKTMRRQIVKGALKKPAWLRVRAIQNERYSSIKSLAATANLQTVCAEAMCPNIAECWGCGTATFMIMGDTCTRACRFCNVNHGAPRPLDPEEPAKLSSAIARLALDYAVITCVDRDDLDDFGAAHFALCIRKIREACPALFLEVLAGDFNGNKDDIKKVLASSPHVFGHNIETVERLQKEVRDPRASYAKSLAVLKFAKEFAPRIFTKSSIMVGLGERPKEVVQAMKDLRKIGVDFLTIGQYLRPSQWNLPVKEYIPPQQFERYKKQAVKLGFKTVASGPFVRSSYKASEAMKNISPEASPQLNISKPNTL